MVKNEKPKLRVTQIYNTTRFDESNSSAIKSALVKCKAKLAKNVKDPAFYKSLIYSKIPIINWLPKYKLGEYLLPDLIAGSTVGKFNLF